MQKLILRSFQHSQYLKELGLKLDLLKIGLVTILQLQDEIICCSLNYLKSLSQSFKIHVCSGLNNTALQLRTPKEP